MSLYLETGNDCATLQWLEDQLHKICLKEKRHYQWNKLSDTAAHNDAGKQLLPFHDEEVATIYIGL